SSALKRAEARAPERGVYAASPESTLVSPVSNQPLLGNYSILSFSVSVPMRAFLHGVEASQGRDIEHAIGRRRRGADRVAEFDGAENFLFLARGEHIKAAAPCAEVNFAIGNQRRPPRFAFDFFGPIQPAGRGSARRCTSATPRSCPKNCRHRQRRRYGPDKRRACHKCYSGLRGGC